VSEGNAPLRCRVIVHVGAHGQPCETFAGLGAVPWAERAAQELRAADDAPHQMRSSAWKHLTAQEYQIATLVAWV
jgi:hypothetical protein